MKKRASLYVDGDSQINLIGLQAGVLSLLFAAYYFFHSPHAPFLMASVLGVLLTSIMMSSTYHEHHSIERNKYGLITAILSGVSYAVGALTGYSLIATSIVVACVFPWAGLIHTKNTLSFWTAFYICDAYIIGFGISHAHLSVRDAALYGAYYMLGGSLLILTGFFRVYIRRRWLGAHESNVYRDVLPLFSFSRYRIIFSLCMTFSVLVANFFAHLSESHLGFWLTMTTFVLFKYDHGVSIPRMESRIVGTFLGCIATFVLFYFLNGKWFLIFLILPLVYLTNIANSRHYASYTFFLTITVIFIMSMIEQYHIGIISMRFLDTLISVVCVSLVLFCLKKWMPAVE